MANAAALINEGLWRKDKEFQRLPRLAQCTFCQVLSQKDLDTAGGLTLHLDLLAKACDELTVEQLMADLAVLEERRFLFVDFDTDELLVRSYVRLVSFKSSTGKENNAWRSVPKNARLIASEKLRHELAIELRRLRFRAANDLADEIDPLPTPSTPPPDPLRTPSKSEGGPNPPSTVPVPVLVSPSIVSSVGEEPPPQCPKHLNHTDPPPCHGCRKAREANQDWHAGELDRRRAAREAAKAIADACLVCHGTNQIAVDDNTVRKCNHDQEAM